MFKIIFDAVTNVAGFLKRTNALDGLVSLSSAKTTVANLSAQLCQVTFKSECHAKAVFANEHHIVVRAAKARFIGFDTDVGLHHGCTENQIQFVFFQFAIERAKGASARRICRRRFKRLVDRYGKIHIHKTFLLRLDTQK
jgi:hypothetical protein